MQKWKMQTYVYSSWSDLYLEVQKEREMQYIISGPIFCHFTLSTTKELSIVHWRRYPISIMIWNKALQHRLMLCYSCRTKQRVPHVFNNQGHTWQNMTNHVYKLSKYLILFCTFAKRCDSLSVFSALSVMPTLHLFLIYDFDSFNEAIILFSRMIISQQIGPRKDGVSRRCYIIVC